jgi:hypothetical protein
VALTLKVLEELPPVYDRSVDAVEAKIRENRTASWYRHRPDPTPHTWRPVLMASCIAVSFPGRWERVRDGCARATEHSRPSRCAGAKPGEMWVANERGMPPFGRQRSWRTVDGYATSLQRLRGRALQQRPARRPLRFFRVVISQAADRDVTAS